MTSRDLIDKYLFFFKKRDHAIIPSSSLIPENDPSALFTSAGMHPLIPYLLGEKHPEGKRLANNQICLRMGDIDEVGDTTHNTFFEMLGNWSLGDYWKEEAISWSYEFIVKELDLDPKRIWITCFAGDKDAPKDTESARVWKKLGIPNTKTFFYGKKDNWWGPAGETGPCGPDSEMFYDVTKKSHGSNCRPGDNCGRFFEIWNDVFMQYEKTKDGKFLPFKQRNVDTGMGVERTTAVLQGLSDNYEVEDLWGKTVSHIEEVSKVKYKGNEKPFRIIADHIRAATFVISEGVEPSNKERGYVLRRLIRRAIRFGKELGLEESFLPGLGQVVVEDYKLNYKYLEGNLKKVKEVLNKEEERFRKTLNRGLREIEKLDKVDAKIAFFLYETYGFPVELTEEIVEEKGQKIDKLVFEKEFEKHKNLSRTASAGMFKGGLADHSEKVTKLHTATHLLHASLRKVFGKSVRQKGSNITKDRLRFDFTHKEKLGNKELKDIERLINEQIKKNLRVIDETKTYKEAVDEGALAFFGKRYGEKVKVYTIDDPKSGWFSKEVCGGPHVKRTSEIGRVKINKQKKIGTGVIRLYAVLSK